MTMATGTLNLNVGVLGHIDSGKTSLAKALSTVASTACFDKNPQSRERGITLDLGFSSFGVDLPSHLKEPGFDRLQFTLVDCPGHASLIRTIIGGAQIIDMMMLVIDVTKGIQTQTAECLVIGEITCDKMIIVLNKIDLIPEDKRATSIEKLSKRLQKTLENTKFAGCAVISVAAKPGGPEAPDTDGVGINELIDTLKVLSFKPKRNHKGPFIFAADHCFSIKGQGTVLTGTVLSGGISVNDTVEIPSLKVTKKIKSIQMFKNPVNSILQGDRAGICVTQFDPKHLERGLVCLPGVLQTANAAIVKISKIGYFKGAVTTKAKFHVTVAHETVMGRGAFFGLYSDIDKDDDKTDFDFTQDYLYQEELLNLTDPKSSGSGEDSLKLPTAQFALFEFEKPIICGKHFLVIGSKLDTDIHSNACRLAFHGQLLEAITEPNYAETFLPQLKVYKIKKREGIVERKVDEYTVICRNLFKKETNMDAFVGLKVTLSSGEQGVIEGGFGQGGKAKIRIPAGLSEVTAQMLGGKGGKKAKTKASTSEVEPSTICQDASSSDSQSTASIKVFLDFKRYIYDPKKKMIQK